MTNQKPILLLKNLSAKISGVHPLLYIVLYISAIPVFAGIYFAIPSGFYAPYARLEYSGQSDAYQTGVLIQTAIRRALHARSSKSSVLVQKLKEKEEMLYVQRLSAMDSSKIKFEVLAMLWDEGKRGYIQIPMNIVMQASSGIIAYSSRTGPKLFRFVELDNADRIPVELRHIVYSAFVEIFRPPDDIFGHAPLLELSSDEDQKLSRFFDGIGGDATAISGAYGRMLYFSSMVITTVGFGDIVPITGLARTVVALEAALGIILAGLFLNALANNLLIKSQSIIKFITEKGKVKYLSGIIFGENTFQNDNLLFFNGKSNYIDFKQREFQLPITIQMEFKLNKENEWWATLFSWNNIEQPHDGIQIALERNNENIANRIVGRIGEAGKGDIFSDIEMDKDRNWHTVTLSADISNIYLKIDSSETKQKAREDRWLPDGKRYNLYIGKSFLDEFFNGTIRNIQVSNQKP